VKINTKYVAGLTVEVFKEWNDPDGSSVEDIQKFIE
jgi:hypothetical protein